MILGLILTLSERSVRRYLASKNRRRVGRVSDLTEECLAEIERMFWQSKSDDTIVQMLEQKLGVVLR